MGRKVKQKIIIQKRCLISVVMLVLLTSTSSYAGLDKLIKNVMPQGTMQNSTKGAIIRGQEAGHLIGGSVMIKSPAPEDLQLINMQPPTCKLGGLPCGAQIDIRAGGLSFVSAAGMSDFLKKMAQGVPAYATLLMLKTISPVIEGAMTYLNDVAAEANKLAINQCEAMEGLVGATLSMVNAGSKATRQSAMVNSGAKKDMSSIQDSSLKDTDDSKDGAKELESLLGDNYNLVWKALENKSMAASGDDHFRELLMSISGTIIGTKENNVIAIVHKNSLVSKELIKEFIGTSQGESKLKLYHCDTASLCLKPEVRETGRIKADDTLMGQVTNLLKSIAEKVHNNKGDANTINGFTADEESLISLATIPIIRKMEMDLAVYKDAAWAVHAQSEFVEALCYDVVTNYLAALLNEVTMAVGDMSRLQLTDRSVFDDFQRETGRTMTLLGQAKSESFRRYSIIEQSKAMLRQTENDFNRRFEEFISQSNS